MDADSDAIQTLCGAGRLDAIDAAAYTSIIALRGRDFTRKKGGVAVTRSTFKFRYLGLCIAFGFAFSFSGARAQQALVIEGGTLIDVNGGEPVPNAVVIVEGN